MRLRTRPVFRGDVRAFASRAGYREAECGWVMVQEDETGDEQSSSSRAAPLRTVLFLVIYAAKRGILEVLSASPGLVSIAVCLLVLEPGNQIDVRH